MSGWTKGPWEFKRIGCEIFAPHAPGRPKNARVCFGRVNHAFLAEEELLANGRLIAAAPDLVTTIARVEADPNFGLLGHLTREMVRAALRKAGAK